MSYYFVNCHGTKVNVPMTQVPRNVYVICSTIDELHTWTWDPIQFLLYYNLHGEEYIYELKELLDYFGTDLLYYTESQIINEYTLSYNFPFKNFKYITQVLNTVYFTSDKKGGNIIQKLLLFRPGEDINNLLLNLNYEYDLFKAQFENETLLISKNKKIIKTKKIFDEVKLDDNPIIKINEKDDSVSTKIPTCINKLLGNRFINLNKSKAISNIITESDKQLFLDNLFNVILRDNIGPKPIIIYLNCCKITNITGLPLQKTRQSVISQLGLLAFKNPKKSNHKTGKSKKISKKRIKKN
jgi:hypothetical protein